jgi:hypothetical protein
MDRRLETYEELLGFFAMDIRNDWSSEVPERIARMRTLMDLLGVDYEIDEEACVEDGRWMRDVWLGPYWSGNGWPIMEDADLEACDEYYDDLHFPPECLSKAVQAYRCAIETAKLRS